MKLVTGTSHRILSCRSCGTGLSHTFVDLGFTPLANSLVTAEARCEPMTHYPLHAYVCESCLLVQVGQFNAPSEIFSDYLYFSSYSATWRDHCRRHAETMIARLGLGRASFVAEVASNDGCLIRNFVEAGIPSLGIEPASNIAEIARQAGVPTETAFFGRETAERIARSTGCADLIIANNVMAHVPELNDFLAGFHVLLKDEGVATIEFPHLLNLIRDVQFDTIYHEHFSYFSLHAAEKALNRNDLVVVDVEELPVHGGSLRLYVMRKGGSAWKETDQLTVLRKKERDAGLLSLAAYEGFVDRVFKVKLALLEFLLKARREGKTVAAFGAAAKGNTLLNYSGVRNDLISFVCDSNPYKQDKFLPGSGIPVLAPEAIAERRPDYLLILPWNLKDEIATQNQAIRAWGGHFITAIPSLSIF